MILSIRPYAWRAVVTSSVTGRSASLHHGVIKVSQAVRSAAAAMAVRLSVPDKGGRI